MNKKHVVGQRHPISKAKYLDGKRRQATSFDKIPKTSEDVILTKSIGEVSFIDPLGPNKGYADWEHRYHNSEHISYSTIIYANDSFCFRDVLVSYNTWPAWCFCGLFYVYLAVRSV
jgi:hypothetical protein